MAFNEFGLVIPRAPEILDDIQDYQVANVVPKFKYQNNKIIYQLNSVYALKASELAELIEAAFDSTKLSSAEGTHLEELGLLRGVYRAQAVASSTSSQYAWMLNGRSIPSGTVFSSSIVTNTAVTTSLTEFQPTLCNGIRFKVLSSVDEEPYTITINNKAYTYTSGVGESISDITLGILDEFDDDSTASFTYEEEDNGVVKVLAEDGSTMSASLSTSLIEISQVKVYFYLEATETGPVDFPANTMDSVSTAVVGLISTNNDDEFTLGKEIESDEEFRLSIQAGNSSASSGTLLSIESRLKDVSGVSAVSVIENTNESPTDSDGRPIHSYECLVVGGSDEDVASEVWVTSPAGMRRYGNTVTTIVDSSGATRFVEYSRPLKVNIAVKAEYTLYTEEVFPTEGEDLIMEAIVSYVSSLPLGKDVIPLRVANVAANATTGIETMVISLQVLTSSGDTPDPLAWQTTPISIISTEYAFCEEIDTSVSEA